MRTFLEKIHRNRKGFTLAEVLIVVAIMAILAGFGFVAVSRYNKKLTLMEMDDTAKKIFLAAQNHLTIADANGEWKQLKLKEETETGENGISKLGVTCHDVGNPFRVIYGGKSENTDTEDVRKMLLPDLSINIASDGSYAVIYDPDTASVYGVYYSASSTFGNGQNATSFLEIVGDDLKKNNSSKNLRNDKELRGEQKPLIGYYGNTSGNKGVEKKENTEISSVQKLKVYFINSKELTLVIEDPNASLYYNSDTKKIPKRDFYISVKDPFATSSEEYTLLATAEDENYAELPGSVDIKDFINQGYIPNSNLKISKSYPDTTKVGAEMKLYTLKSGTVTMDKGVLPAELIYFITFDSLTQQEKHFSNLFPAIQAGADVTANVTMSVELDGSISVVSGSDTDNSLFDEIKNTTVKDAENLTDSKDYKTASITNVRHLENLSPAISNLSSDVTAADLETNLDLNGTDGWKNGAGAYPSIYLSDGKTKLINLNENANFAGISLRDNFARFSGNGKQISNMRLSYDAYAEGQRPKALGLFTTVPTAEGAPSLIIASLTLDAPLVDAGSAVSAGTLLGDAEKSLTLRNITIKDSVPDTDSTVESSGIAGGVLGKFSGQTLMAGKVKLSDNVSVKSTGNVSGGFAGSVIADTVALENISLDPDTYTKDASGTVSRNTNGHVWIGNDGAATSGGEADASHVGGLIGYLKLNSTDQSTISKSYVLGGNTGYAAVSKAGSAGGLIGKIDGGSLSIQDTHVSTYVQSADEYGAGGFIGEISGGNLNVSESYVGGRTSGTYYINDTLAIDTNAIEGNFADKAGRYNVQALNSKINTAAGGFIGRIGNGATVDISNAYTTASVYVSGATGSAGGFIGSNYGNLSCGNTYTTSLVHREDNTETNADRYIGGTSKTITALNGESNYVVDGIYGITRSNAEEQVDNVKACGSDQVQSVVTINESPLSEINGSASGDALPYDTALSDDYPLKNMEELSSGKLASGHEITLCKDHEGDWPTAKETSRTFDGDFGILYYEQVQDGDEANAPTHYYYHGYVGYETGSDKITDEQYSEIFTRDTLNESQAPGVLDRGNKALPIEHGKYVVEQGYLILVRDELSDNNKKLNNIKVDLLYQSAKNSSARTLYELIHGTNGATKALYQEGDHYYSEKMNFTGFNCYYIKPDQDLSALYPGNNFTQLRFAQKDATGNYQWDNSATFAFNPMFSDISLMNSSSVNVKGTYTYKARSAETLYNLFTTNYAMNDGWNSKLHMKIGLDISYRDTLKFQQFDITTGKPKDVTWDSDQIILSQLHFEMYSSYPEKEAATDSTSTVSNDKGNANLYSLDYLTAPLIGENVDGNLHDMHFIHYDPSNEIITNHKTKADADHMSAALLGTCTNAESIVNNIYIENTSGPVLDMAKGSIDNVVIDNISIYKNFGNQGIFCSGNEGTINHLTIKSIDVQETGAIGAVFETNGGIIGGTSDSGSSKNTVNIEKMIVSGKINSQGVLIGSMGSGSAKPHHISLTNVTIKNGAIVGNKDKPSGIIGECYGGGKLHDFSMDSIKVEEGATIKGTYWGIIGSNQDEIYNFTLTGIDFSKIPLGDNVGIIGENGSNINNSSGQKISVSDYSTSGYGFVVQNNSNANIKNVTIQYTAIAKSGFCKLNLGTIDNCRITADSDQNTSTIYENGFVESNNKTITNCTVEDSAISMSGFAGTNESDGALQNCKVDHLTIVQNGFVGINNGRTVQNCIVSNSTVGQNGFVGTNNGIIDTGCLVRDTDVISGSGFVGENSGTIGNGDWNSSEANIVSLLNVKIFGSNAKVAGFVTENNGTIQHVDLKNIVAGNVGFAYTNYSNISKCRIINAWISETGFVRINEDKGKIEYCQIYGDSNVLMEGNSRLKTMDSEIFDETKRTSDVYGLIQVGKGLNKKENQYSYTDDASGFARNNNGNITYSSVTGELYGKIHASGFVFRQNKTISHCYANTIIKSDGDGYGFCYDMTDGSDISLDSCFSVGKIKATMVNTSTKTKEPDVRGSSGFIGSFSKKATARNCYSAVWEIDAPLYYNFVRNPGIMSGCRYLVFPGAMTNDVDYQNNEVNGLYKCSSLQLMNSTWDKPNITTLQYGQYYSWMNQDASNAIYPYPMQKDWAYDFKFIGDWWEDGTITEHQSGTISKAKATVNLTRAPRLENIENPTETGVEDYQIVSSSAIQEDGTSANGQEKSDNETVYETQNSPAGITKAPQQIVTNKVKVRKKAS